MITNLYLHNFKCFQDANIELSNLNVLTGLNGMGKSSVIQSLLMVRQSAIKYRFEDMFLLNGSLVQLGTGKDVLCEYANDDCIKIGIKEDDKDEVVYELEYAPYEDSLKVNHSSTSGGIVEQLMMQERMNYLSAYRIKPMKLYDMTNAAYSENINFGNDGLNALQYLEDYGADEILEALVLQEDEYPNTLMEQVRLWMNDIAPGVNISVRVDKKKQMAELGYSFVEGKDVTNVYNCVNVGFGITYVLPIVVALLSAKPGEILILENPEAHIHPAGQRRLGELIAWVARTGVQMIVETHSDHILNGIRISVKNKKLESSLIKLMYFYKDKEDNYQHKFVVPVIDQNGRLDQWPKGFFDEWENELLELL